MSWWAHTWQLAMNKKLSLILLISAMIVATCSATAAFAQMQWMQSGLGKLSEGKYTEALASFENAVKAKPGDVQARYCMAVCLQHLGRHFEAAREYRWVKQNATDPALARRADKGLSGCVGAGPATGTGGIVTGGDDAAPGCFNPGWSKTEGTDIGAPTPASSATGAAGVISRGLVRNLGETPVSSRPVTSTAPAQTTATGTPKVVDVYTDWCGWCKKFAPLFDQARTKFGGSINFERINAEEGNNKELTRSWGVRGYPTTVLFDGNGRIVDIVRGCPKSYEEFEQRITKAFPSVQ